MSDYKYLNFIKHRVYDFEVLSNYNDKKIWELVLDIDGFYYFEPILIKGYWSSYWMKEICNKLDELNTKYE
jgi:uncharacterized membrane protein